MLQVKKDYLIIDFDSTFSQVESLDLLCEISHSKNDLEVLDSIKKLTNQGMNGEISLKDSLQKRITLINATKRDLDKLILILKQKISLSFIKNKSFIRKNASYIYIVSNGFKEFITPIVADFNIGESHVLANTFTYDEKFNISGMDLSNPLTEDGGKAKVVEKLGLTGTIHAIGDGLNDYDIKKRKQAHFFYAYVENIYRKNVVQKADLIADNLDKIIKHIYK